MMNQYFLFFVYRLGYGDKEDWSMVKLESHDATVRYGDKVYIVNRSYGGQKLCQYGSWLSTSGNTSEFWVIERG